jgi:hypothetical protein
MGDSSRKSHWLLKNTHDLLQDTSSLHFSDFVDITDTFMAGYARFSNLGLPDRTIALAMLGATINVYDLFGLRGDLPDIFRSLADKIEAENQPH